MKKSLINIKFRILWLVVAAVIMLFAATASAAPVFTDTFVSMYLKQNTFPSGLNEEKVYLDMATLATITGHVGSQTNSRLVNFSSTTDTLDAANGFATIKAGNPPSQHDDSINNMTITAPGHFFRDLIFSLNLAPNDNNNLTITAVDSLGGTHTFASWTGQHDWVNGDNDILVLATSQYLLQSVTIDSVYGIQQFGVDQLKQTQISGYSDVGVSPVPIPAAVWLLGTGLVGLLGIRRRFQK